MFPQQCFLVCLKVYYIQTCCPDIRLLQPQMNYKNFTGPLGGMMLELSSMLKLKAFHL